METFKDASAEEVTNLIHWAHDNLDQITICGQHPEYEYMVGSVFIDINGASFYCTPYWYQYLVGERDEDETHLQQIEVWPASEEDNPFTIDFTMNLTGMTYYQAWQAFAEVCTGLIDHYLAEQNA